MSPIIPGVSGPMRTAAFLAALLAENALAGATPATQKTPPKAAPFVLSSTDSELASNVPEVYTAKAFGCSGGNLSPPLRWTGVPRGTQSFVLTLFDRDERSTPSGWWHWVVYDLPGATSELAKGAGAHQGGSLPTGSLQGRSDLGEDAYHGPCPAKGDPPHRYVFTLYALDVAKLPVDPDSSGAMITSVAGEHLLAKAVLVAHYGRPNGHPSAQPK